MDLQRLLFARTLPLAARLNGLTLLHASAVSLDGVLAMTGQSGMGKSSVGLHPAALGAPFFCDDVVALEQAGDTVIAPPGTRFANVHAHELEKLPAERQALLGQQVGRSHRVHLEPAGAAQPAQPLKALYELRRVDWPEPVVVEAVPAPDPLMVLGSGFLPQMSVAGQQAADLHMCGAVASAGKTFRVKVPHDNTAADVAAALLEHGQGLG